MASKTDICNLALNMVGSPPVSSLDENCPEASIVKQLYDPIRDEVLQLKQWPSCTGRAVLNLISEGTPAFEFQYAFQLPADYIDLIRYGDSDTAVIPYRIEGDQLLTNQGAPCQIVYIRREERTGLYEPLLVDMIATRMAKAMAMRLPANASLKESLDKDWEVLRQRAKDSDGTATGSPTITYVSFIDARS